MSVSTTYTRPGRVIQLQPKRRRTFVAMATGTSIIEYVTEMLQTATNVVNNWAKKWSIKLNEAKTAHITFTNETVNPIPMEINAQ